MSQFIYCYKYKISQKLPMISQRPNKHILMSEMKKRSGASLNLTGWKSEETFTFIKKHYAN